MKSEILALCTIDEQEIQKYKDPCKALWWKAFTDGIRMAILDVLNRDTRFTDNKSKFYKKGMGINWLMSNKDSNKVGSVLWIVSSLDINYLSSIRNFVVNSNREDLEEVLKILT